MCADGVLACAYVQNKVLARIHEKSENFHITAGMGVCRPGIFDNQVDYCITALYRICVQ